MDVELKIPEGTMGGAFGIWFLSEPGSDGTFFGVSPRFQGLGLVVKIEQTRNMNELRFYLLQSPAMHDFSEEFQGARPDYRIFFWPKKPVIIQFNFLTDKLRFTVDTTNSPTPRSYVEKPLNVSLQGYYIGITAQNDRLSSRIDLHTVRFSHLIPKTPVHLVRDSGRFSPSNNSKLRSAHFNKLLDIIENRTDYSSEDFSNLLFTSLEELFLVSKDAASFSMVEAFVRKSIVPYCEKWHERTIKMIQRMSILRDVMSSAWKFTGNIMSELNETVWESSQKMSRKIEDLSDVLSEESRDDSGNVVVLSFATDPFDWRELIMYGMLMEILCVIGYLLAMQNSTFREKRTAPKRRRTVKHVK
jgi:hypothetical protein